MLIKSIRASLVVLVAMTVLTGLVYPAFVTIIAQTVFPNQADGSLLRNEKGTVIGSALIGQEFTGSEYFWSRPSATGPVPYNAAVSSGSNLGAAADNLKTNVQGRIKALQEADPANGNQIPVDLVTASGSGLDPHISVAAAQYQAGRVAAARGIDKAKINNLISEHTEPRQLGFLGDSRVNVLQLNRSLDAITATP